MDPLTWGMQHSATICISWWKELGFFFLLTSFIMKINWKISVTYKNTNLKETSCPWFSALDHLCCCLLWICFSWSPATAGRQRVMNVWWGSPNSFGKWKFSSSSSLCFLSRFFLSSAFLGTGGKSWGFFLLFFFAISSIEWKKPGSARAEALGWSSRLCHYCEGRWTLG